MTQITEYSGSVPALNQTQPEFDQNTQDFIDYMAGLAPEINQFASELNNLSTTVTSSSSVAIGTGTKNFTVETGKSLFVGMSYKMAYDANNWMLGDIISYNSGTGALSIDVDTVRGSGTYAAWVGTLAFNGQVEGAQLAPSLISSLTAETAPAIDDELMLGDTSLSALRKMTLANMLKVINSLTEDTTPDLNADYLLSYDASASAVKKVLMGRSSVVMGTAQLTTSGNSKDFTGLPDWLSVLMISFSGVSSNGTAYHNLQIGDAGGIESSGYGGSGVLAGNASASSGAAYTSGVAFQGNAAANIVSGAIMLVKHDASNTWVFSGVHGLHNTAFAGAIGASKQLSGPLDRFRFSTTDTFDAGSINWMGW
jgi:hypothetical protein